MNTVPALLLRCEPWLVAIPLDCVRRIADDGTIAAVAGGTGGEAWLGEVAAGGDRLPAWDLGRLLGLPGDAGASWVLIDRPLTAALRTGRCLRVADLPQTALRPLPRLAGGPQGSRVFALDGGFGLLVDPATLLHRATAGATA